MERLGNVQFQTLAITGDTRGVSTQFMSFLPNQIIKWAQVIADINQLFFWEEVMICSRTDFVVRFQKRIFFGIVQ